MITVRRRLCYSLRAGLVVVTLLCIALGTVGRRAHRLRMEQRAVEAIAVEGGVVLGKRSAAADPRRRGPAICVEWLPAACWLREQPGVEFVFLEETPQSGAAIYAHLALLTEVRHLSVGGPSFADEQCRFIAADAPLSAVGLQGPRLTSRGLRSVLRPTIIQLSVIDAPIGDEGVQAIAQLPLVSLRLQNCPGVTAEGVAALARSCQTLQELSLVEMNLGDGAVPHLAHLGRLVELDVSGCGLTTAGAKRLAQTAPRGCVVYTDFGPYLNGYLVLRKNPFSPIPRRQTVVSRSWPSPAQPGDEEVVVYFPWPAQ